MFVNISNKFYLSLRNMIWLNTITVLGKQPTLYSISPIDVLYFSVKQA